MKRIIAAAVAALSLAVVPVASANTVTVTRSDGYQVTLTGPTTGVVGAGSTYTATCGPIGWHGSPCPYSAFRMYGGPLNSLGEGFGTGPTGTYTFRAAGSYTVRERVGASCIGSPRLACPIDVFMTVGVTS